MEGIHLKDRQTFPMMLAVSPDLRQWDTNGVLTLMMSALLNNFVCLSLDGSWGSRIRLAGQRASGGSTCLCLLQHRDSKPVPSYPALYIEVRD